MPCFANPVYEYILMGKCSVGEMEPPDIPDPALKNTVYNARQICNTMFT